VEGAYYSDPVPEMRVVRVVRNEVRGDRHDDDGRDPVQGMVRKDKGTMDFARAGGRSTVVVRSVCTSHCFRDGTGGVVNLCEV
jgi:hypothetical protein